MVYMFFLLLINRVFTNGLILSLRAKLSSLSEFVREIKVGFASQITNQDPEIYKRWVDDYLENGKTIRKTRKTIA